MMIPDHGPAHLNSQKKEHLSPTQTAAGQGCGCKNAIKYKLKQVIAVFYQEYEIRDCALVDMRVCMSSIEHININNVTKNIGALCFVVNIYAFYKLFYV